MALRDVLVFGLLAGFAASVGGCGKGDSRVEVSGQVVFDGQPVRVGMVTFEPSSGTAPPQSAAIEDGGYQTALEPGQYLVRITAPDMDKMGPPPDDIHEPAPEYVSLLPASWNDQSALNVEVKPGTGSIHFRGAEGEPPRAEAGAGGS